MADETKQKADEDKKRYYMRVFVVKAKRQSGATWIVYGPWDEPFHVNDEAFQKVFTQI